MNSAPAQFEDEELSDEQIQWLLGEAKARLTRFTENLQRSSDRKQPSGRLIPRLQTVISHAPYIREKDGIAKADPKMLISNEQRKLAETPRTIESVSAFKKTVRRPRTSRILTFT